MKVTMKDKVKDSRKFKYGALAMVGGEYGILTECDGKKMITYFDGDHDFWIDIKIEVIVLPAGTKVELTQE